MTTESGGIEVVQIPISHQSVKNILDRRELAEAAE